MRDLKNMKRESDFYSKINFNDIAITAIGGIMLTVLFVEIYALLYILS